MIRVGVNVLMAAVLVLAAPAAARAQGAQVSLRGTVSDTDGVAVTGAIIRVRHTATGAEVVVYPNVQGGFTVTRLEPGEYTVTVTRLGFTSAVQSVTIAPGEPASVKIVLEVKPLPQADPGVPVVVTGEDVNRLPTASRHGINAVTFLPGVNSPDVNRRSTINGLTGSFLTVSFDGVNANDNLGKSTAGLATATNVRQDAAADVAITLTAPEAAGPGGAAVVAFRTRSGTDRFLGSGYDTFRVPAFSGPDWFARNAGQPKVDASLHQIGVRQGGPVILPGLADGRGRAFFFVNYEELHDSGAVARVRSVLTPLAQSGVFRYPVIVNDAMQIREVNLFALAGAAGVGAALDPTVAALLNDIRAATVLAQAGGRAVNGRLWQSADPNVLSYGWQSPAKDVERQPVLRFDLNLSSDHRVSVTYSRESVARAWDHRAGSDPAFPGLPNAAGLTSARPLVGASVRSAITSAILNEFTFGARWGQTLAGSAGTSGRTTFGRSDGYALALGPGLTDWHAANGTSTSSAGTWNIANTVRWQKGGHQFSFGGAIHLGRASIARGQMAPTITFGVEDVDPALAFFTLANMPGSSPDQRARAASLFALLTGRVSGIGGFAARNEASNTYELFGPRTVTGRQTEYALFAQDDWHPAKAVTITAGVRWTVQMPFTSDSDALATTTPAGVCGVSGIGPSGVCRFNQPGIVDGDKTSFRRFAPGTRAWGIRWNNVAPSASLAWRPGAEDGWLRAAFGDPEVATFRLGYAEAFAREGMGLYLEQMALNAGGVLNLSRSAATGTLIPEGEAAPIFLQERSRLALGPVPASTVFPLEIRPGRVDDIGAFAPAIDLAHARTLTASFLRSIGPETSAEVRWIGTLGRSLWTPEDYNYLNIIDNNFFSEFRLAMVNLEKNLAAGRGATFAYFGPGTGTSPLPIFLAYLTGQPIAGAGDAALYTGVDWTNPALVSRLALQSADPYGAARDLDGNARRRANAAAAGLPANSFVLNPDAGRVSVYDSRGSSRHDAIQVEVRRHLPGGLQATGSYQYAWASASKYFGPRYGYVTDPVGTVRHAIKAQWAWTLPIGRDRLVGRGMSPALDAIVGGWSVSGVARIQARTIDFGNVRLVGMTRAQLEKEYRVRVGPDPFNPGREIVTFLPADIVLNTQRAFNVDATSPTGYSALGVPEGRYLAPANDPTCVQLGPGDCAPRTHIVQAPWFSRVDVSVAKRIQTRGRVNVEVRLDIFNLLDQINFTPGASPGAGPAIFQATSAYRDLDTYDPGGRLGQLALRVRW